MNAAKINSHLLKLIDERPLLLYYFLGIFLLLYVFLRAVWIPITIDEVNTILLHSQRDLWDILTYKTDPIPNNHILNTLIIKVLTKMFGFYQLIPRLPNILGFILYFVAAVGFCRKAISNQWLAFGAVLWLTINPYLLDFFSVARGYGLANGFLMCSLYYSLRWLETKKINYILHSLLMAALSVYANFAWLLPFCALNMVFFLWFIFHNKWNTNHFFKLIIIQGGITGILGFISYLPIKRMSETDQFHFWGSKGFYEDTLKSITDSLLKNSATNYWGSQTSMIIIWIGAALLLFAFIMIVKKYHEQKSVDNAAFFLGVFLTTILVNIIQHHLLGTAYPTTRTALFYFPIFTTSLIFVLPLLYENTKRVAYGLAFVLTFGSIWHFGHTFNTKNVSEWWFDTHTFDVLKAINDSYQSEQRTEPYILYASSWLMPSLHYYIYTQQPNYVQDPPFLIEPDTTGKADFYYCFNEDKDKIMDKYEEVLNHGGQFLMRRKK
jgi:hypothetical protein